MARQEAGEEHETSLIKGNKLFATRPGVSAHFWPFHCSKNGGLPEPPAPIATHEVVVAQLTLSNWFAPTVGLGVERTVQPDPFHTSASARNSPVGTRGPSWPPTAMHQVDETHEIEPG
jgi:hypothetical protein